MPLLQRIPKLRGFKNPFRIEYVPVNLDILEALGVDVVTPETLARAGVVRKGALVKVLGRGEIRRSVEVHAHASFTAPRRRPSRPPVVASSGCPFLTHRVDRLHEATP